MYQEIAKHRAKLSKYFLAFCLILVYTFHSIFAKTKKVRGLHSSPNKKNNKQ